MVGRFNATTTGGEVARDEGGQDSAIGASGRLRQGSGEVAAHDVVEHRFRHRARLVDPASTTGKANVVPRRCDTEGR